MVVLYAITANNSEMSRGRKRGLHKVLIAFYYRTRIPVLEAIYISKSSAGEVAQDGTGTFRLCRTVP
jgi:hypothetical protein